MGSLLALALSAAVLLPPWPLSPDGDVVAVRGADDLVARGAEVERIAPGLFWVRPAEGSRSVVLAAGDARAEAAVEPAAGTIEITADPPAPVKGRDLTVQLVLAVRDASGGLDAGAAPPLVVASSGQIQDLSADGPGRFRASYRPAPARHPEVAVLFALSPRCPQCATPRAVGDLILPLAAAIDLPGESEPGIRTTVSVGGRTFGPVIAGEDGRFKVPILVPPGARALAHSVDAIGNTRETPLDLGLPEVDRIACAAWPRALPADGRSEADLWCAAAEAAGAPAQRPVVRVTASAGVVAAPEELRPGLLRARYRAPRGGGGGEAVLAVAYPAGGAASRDEVRIALGSGPPAEILASLEREPVLPGASVAARTSVRDARGDTVGAPRGPAGAVVGFVSPERFVAQAAGAGWVQRASLSFALPPGRTLATLGLRRRGAEWVAEARTHDARPAVGVPLAFGSGARATTDARGEARVAAAGPAETVVSQDGARAAAWEGFEPPEAPTAIARELEVHLRPGSPVDVVARVEGRTLRWQVQDAAGGPLSARPVVLRASGLVVGPPQLLPGGGRATLGPGRGTVAVVDVETGVAAVVEVH
jgi:hypothetical protein